jgi:enoyl-CoA hydratase/carnithine racemase
MVYDTVEFRKMDHVGLIRIREDIRDHHGYSRLMDEIAEVSRAITFEDPIWVVVLTGIGRLASSMGKGSVTSFYETGEMEDAIQGSVAEPVANIEKPVIAEIDGDALDQGLELILACDLRIASEKSRFGLSQVDHGLIPWDGGTQRLSRLIGKGNALEMILTGVSLGAADAQRIGLVNRVVPDHELENTVLQLAQGVTSKSPLALKYAKEAINNGMDLTLEQGLRLEVDLYMLLHTCRDRTEGIKAFQEKREPKFTGE